MGEYMIAGGAEGKGRLDLQAAALRPSTLELMSEIGVQRGWRCLDVGCGPGWVTNDLARLVGPEGSAVGLDFDEVVLDLAQKQASDAGILNVEFRPGRAETLDEHGFQLAYTRLLLDILAEPMEALTRMTASVVPGGVVAAEEAEVTSSFCFPACEPFDRWIGWFAKTMRGRGGDPDIGVRLPELFRSVGLRDIGLRIVHLAWMGGEEKWLWSMLMDSVRQAVVDDGVATAFEFDEVAGALRSFIADSTTIVGYCRFFQVWGYRPG